MILRCSVLISVPRAQQDSRLVTVFEKKREMRHKAHKLMFFKKKTVSNAKWTGNITSRFFFGLTEVTLLLHGFPKLIYSQSCMCKTVSNESRSRPQLREGKPWNKLQTTLVDYAQ